MSTGRTPLQPEFVDAKLQAARGATMEREFSLMAMPRLTESAVSAAARAQLQARFHLVESRAAIAGRATANLRLTCQRCLGPVDVVVDDAFHVIVVASEAEMNQLSDAQDVIIADASQLDLVWLTEEQLLLAMPLVPTHSSFEACAARVESSDAGSSDGKFENSSMVEARTNEMVADENKTQRPFANLRELLKKD